MARLAHRDEGLSPGRAVREDTMKRG